MSDKPDPKVPLVKYGAGHIKCSKCGTMQFNLQSRRFCPECGRAMVIK